TPSGKLLSTSSETSIRVLSDAKSAEEIEHYYIQNRDDSPIYKHIQIKEVASAVEGIADVRRISRLNGQRAIGFGVVKQRESNAVSVADAVKGTIKNLSELLPDGMRINWVYDSTRFIKESIHELVLTMCLSAILTSIVCWLFLGSW